MYKQSISSDEAACQAHIFAKNTSSKSLCRKKLAREAKLFHSTRWFTMRVSKQIIS